MIKIHPSNVVSYKYSENAFCIQPAHDPARQFIAELDLEVDVDDFNADVFLALMANGEDLIFYDLAFKVVSVGPYREYCGGPMDKPLKTVVVKAHHS